MTARPGNAIPKARLASAELAERIRAAGGVLTLQQQLIIRG